MEEAESKFRKPGMAARFNIGENEAFVRVLNEQGNAKLYVFYEEDVQELYGGGINPQFNQSLNERFLVRKGDGAFFKFNPKKKRRKAQLIQLFGDCEKIKTFLEKPKLDTSDIQILRALLATYNNTCSK